MSDDNDGWEEIEDMNVGAPVLAPANVHNAQDAHAAAQAATAHAAALAAQAAQAAIAQAAALAAQAAQAAQAALQQKENILEELIGQILCQTILNNKLITPTDMTVNITKIIMQTTNNEPLTVGILFCNLLDAMAAPILGESANTPIILRRLKLLLGKILHPPVFSVNSTAANIRASVEYQEIGYYFFNSVNSYINLFLSLGIKFVLSNLEQLLADDYLNNGQLDLAIHIFHELSYSIITGSYNSTYSYLLDNSPNALIDNICSYVLEQIAVANNPDWIKINLSQAGDILDVSDGSLYDVKTSWVENRAMKNIGRSDHLAVLATGHNTHLIQQPLIPSGLGINRPFNGIPAGATFRVTVDGIVALSANKIPDINHTHLISFDRFGRNAGPNAIQFWLGRRDLANRTILDIENITKLFELRTAVQMVFKFLRSYSPIDPIDTTNILGRNKQHFTYMLRETLKTVLKHNYSSMYTHLKTLLPTANPAFKQYLQGQINLVTNPQGVNKKNIAFMLNKIASLDRDIPDTFLQMDENSMYNCFGSPVLLPGNTLTPNTDVFYSLRLTDATYILDLLRRTNFPSICREWYAQGHQPDTLALIIESHDPNATIRPAFNQVARLARYENTSDNVFSLGRAYRRGNPVNMPICEILMEQVIAPTNNTGERQLRLLPFAAVHRGIINPAFTQDINDTLTRCVALSQPNLSSTEFSTLISTADQIIELTHKINRAMVVGPEYKSQIDKIDAYVGKTNMETNTEGELNKIIKNTTDNMMPLLEIEREMLGDITRMKELIHSMNSVNTLQHLVEAFITSSKHLIVRTKTQVKELFDNYKGKQQTILGKVQHELQRRKDRKRAAQAQAAAQLPPADREKIKKELDGVNESILRNQTKLAEAMALGQEQNIATATNRIEELDARRIHLEELLGLAGLNKYLKYKAKYLQLKKQLKNRL